MARTAGSNGARTEEAIREAAVALIAERGFEAMTLRELAQRVGIQPGSIYRYFPSKGQMLVDLLVEHLEFLLEGWEQARPATDDSIELLRAFVAFHVSSHTLRRREVFVANMELRSLAPADYRKVVALRRRYEAILVDIVGRGLAAGAFRVPDARITAFALLAMLTGVGSWYSESGRIGKRELIEQYTTLAMQCAGAAAPPPAAPTGSEPDRRQG